MIVEAKAELRKNILQQRDALTDNEIQEKSRQIADRLFDEEHFANADTIAFYLTTGSEVDTQVMLESLIGKRDLLVPVTNSEIEMVQFNTFHDLVPGKFGVLEPKERLPPSGFADVVVVPGISFGLCMHRLGYGMGYYDRFLSRSPAYRIGVCFDFQVMEKLPSHENDQRMDMIITEKRIIKL